MLSMFYNPQMVTTLGIGYSRHRPQRSFGIYLKDRMMHFYAVGQTSSGKSTLLFNMARQDAKHGVGFCLIDPHGDLASNLHRSLSESGLLSKSIYWDVGNPHCPYGYNPLSPVSDHLRPLVASGLIEALHKQWSDAWGPRMEHLLRYAVLALLEYGRGDLRDIVRMYVDREFRVRVVSSVSDRQVRRFWTEELPNLSGKTNIDGVAPIANKLGAFLAHPQVRKSVCAPQTPLRFRSIMDEGKFLIVNVAKGRIGNDVSNVLGGLVLSSLTNSAFSRHELPEQRRRPFMLYVDEFHHFSTHVFANQLAEVRKYALGASLVQQNTTQTDKQVLASILGNAGTIMCFRVGAQDAPILSKQLGTVDPFDLINQPNYQATVRLMVNGEHTRAFSANT